ncbi:cytochrome P450 [Corynascus novoguineensis]|uniref:Cytochrome P450 n=1 Tax=Corynascus novoguineensis TaxID=1126955 RepID=A0AAN7HNM7_9PEZI|nr:cytochrome P450 [Corynascus novoguineensis]
MDALLLTWPAIAVQLLVAVLTLLAWRRYLSPLANVPGPFAASFSRWWHIRHILIGDQNLQLVKLHEKHGHFVRIAHNEVSVSHPDGIKQILLQPLWKAKWYELLQLPDYRYKPPMATLDPKKKVERSRNLASGYTLSNVIKSEDAISRTIEMLLDWMNEYAEKSEPMHLDKFFTYTAFDIVGEVVFSKKFGFLQEGEDIGNSIANSLALNAYAAVGGFLQPWNLIVANPLVTWLRIMPMGHLFDTTMKAIGERVRNQDARFDLLAHWFKMLAQHPERMKLRDIHAQATTSVGAGADTVSCGLQSFIYHMLHHPTAWDRVRAEIDAARRDRGLCSDRVVAFEHAQQLPYLQACIKEALRIFGPVPMGLPRVAPKGGLTIGDYTFPAGTILSINPWAVHHSKEIWGPDASEFNPDRWLSDSAAALDKYWIPFGAGYNSCPGQNIAKMELSKILATLVRDYDIRQVNKDQQWKYKAYFTVVPHSWPCYIEKRKDQASF